MISKESFIRQMKNKSYVIASSWEAIRDIEVNAASSTSAYVRAKIGYKYKHGGDTKFATDTFEMHLDGGKWRIGLYRILYSSP